MGAKPPSFNRTFMELKLQTLIRRSIILNSFNRTFMELKLRIHQIRIQTSCVLIAPLWNWNNQILSQSEKKRTVLIAPLWNWN